MNGPISQNNVAIISNHQRTKSSVQHMDHQEGNQLNAQFPRSRSRLNLPENNEKSPPNNKFSVLNPLKLDEALYREKYYESLNKEGFKKNSGYFTEFVSRNKILTDQYTAERSPLNNHSRYISKPVIFTTLQSKNKLSSEADINHSDLLTFVKHRSTATKNGFRLNTCSGEDYQEDSISRTNNKLDQTNLLLTTNSISPSKVRNRSTGLQNKKLNHLDTSKLSFYYPQSPGSVRAKPIYSLREGIETKLVLPNSPQSVRHKTLLRHLNNVNAQQELIKYHTKILTDALSTDHGEKSKVDPRDFIEHSNDSEYLRQTHISLSKLNQEKLPKRKCLQNVTKYTVKQQDPILYKEPKTSEELHKFDENIIGWTKSVPNFGKQRWTYDKNWEFSLN